jgi:hypothetical protein
MPLPPLNTWLTGSYAWQTLPASAKTAINSALLRYCVSKEAVSYEPWALWMKPKSDEIPKLEASATLQGAGGGEGGGEFVREGVNQVLDADYLRASPGV